MHVELICTITNHIANSYKPTIDSPQHTIASNNTFTKKGQQKATPIPALVIQFSDITA